MPSPVWDTKLVHAIYLGGKQALWTSSFVDAWAAEGWLVLRGSGKLARGPRDEAVEVVDWMVGCNYCVRDQTWKLKNDRSCNTH